MHTVVLLQGKYKSINLYRRAIYRRARRGGEAHKKKWLPFLGHLSPKVYTHYVCFSSFLFSGDLHDSLDILWQPLATCHQGEAMYIGGLGEGRNPKKKKMRFFPWPPLPLREAIYIYTHYVFFPASFSLGIFMTLWTFFGNLRKSDNLCGSLAIPSHYMNIKDRTWCSKNTAFSETWKNGDLTASLSVYI